MTQDTNPHLPELQKRVAQAPTDPGVYRWMNDKGEVLYIGKAKNVRNRLKQYVQMGLPTEAQRAKVGPWKLALIEKIADFDVTVVSNELEALVLETNWIKEHKPKYNVMMKDDKNYVYVRVSVQDPFPGVSVVRQMDEKAKYFGPFISSYDTKRLLDALHMIYDYREEPKALERLNQAAEKGDVLAGVKPSLAYQIGQSCGVSIGKISREEYLERIDALVRFYKGNMQDAKEKAVQLMQEAATSKKFEKAAKLRDAVQLIEHLEEKQLVSDTTGNNTDCIGIAILHGKTQAVVLRERNGKIIDEQNFTLKGSADTVEEALDQFLPQYYAGIPELPDAVSIPKSFDGVGVLSAWLTERKGKKVDVLLPERGKKAQLLTLAQKNAEEKLKAQEARWEAAAKNIELALEELQTVLGLPAKPKRIEGYDISHLGGTETVGSMVVTKNGKPSNKDYRSFTIQSVKEGDIDDYKALAEVLRRRLRYVAADVKTEEAKWNEQGMRFGKAKKSEQKAIEDIVANHPDELGQNNIDYKNYFVGRHENNIRTFARISEYKDGILELQSVWVHKDMRGKKLGKFMAKKVLSKVKNEKIYIIIKDSLESYYADIGFRHVHNPPQILLDEIQKSTHPQDAQLIMVYMLKDHKKDSSLSEKPDLLVIDGGKGQLSTVVTVLKELKLDIPVIGLAKREEEVFQPGESFPTEFAKDSQAKFLLMRLRNEAHRFANRHREKRLTKKTIGSALDDVPGIGPKTRQELLDAFGSVAKIKEASDTALLEIVNKGQLEKLRKRL